MTYPVLYVIAVLNIILGLLPLVLRKRSVANLCFFMFAFGTAFWIFSVIKGWTTTGDITIWGRMAFLGATIMPISILVFVLNYPKKVISVPAPVMGAVLYVPLQIMALCPTSFIVVSIDVSRSTQYNPLGHKIFASYFLLYFLAVFILAILQLKKVTGIDRQKVLYFNIGLFTFIPAMFWSNVIMPMLGTNEYNRIGPLFTSIFLLTSLYSILKHRFMEVRVIVSKSLSIVISYLLVGLGYFAIYSLFTFFFNAKSLNALVVISLFYWGVVSYFFRSLVTHLQSTSEKTLLKGTYDYRKVLRGFSEGLTEKASLNHILEFTYSNILANLELKSVQIVLPSQFESFKKEQNEPEFCVWKREKDKWVPTQRRLDDNSILYHTQRTNPHTLYIGDAHTAVKTELSSLGCDVCIPCVSHQNLVAMLLLGPKLSQDAFSVDDFQLFGTLSAQFALALDRVRPYEKIRHDYEQSLEVAESVSYQASYSTVIRGIAHEIRNPMGMILSGMELILDNLDDKQTISEYASMVKKSIVRLSEITNTMLKYGSPVSEDRESIDMNDILKDVELVSRGECRKRSISMVVEHADVPKVNIDSNSVSQAILNIVLNGMQSTDKDGEIKISLATAKFINKDHEEKKGVLVSISDSGKGIPKDVLYKIFDPFFTTKYQNTGLGLSLVLRIINKHNGKVDVESELGQGTTFHLYFPVN